MENLSFIFRSERSNSVVDQSLHYKRYSKNYLQQILTKYSHQKSSYNHYSHYPLSDYISIQQKKLTRILPLQANEPEQNSAYCSNLIECRSNAKHLKALTKLPLKQEASFSESDSLQHSNALMISKCNRNQSSVINKSKDNCLISIRRKLNSVCSSINSKQARQFSTIDNNPKPKVIRVCVLPRIHKNYIS